MDRMKIVLLTIFVAWLGIVAGDAANAADPNAFSCAGISEIPGGATPASDKNGNAVLVTSSGTVIRCDGSGTFADLAAANASTSSPRARSSTVISSFVAPGSSRAWTMTQETFLPGSNQDLVGYLGSNADQSIVFWRSEPGGPIETWTSDATLIP